MITSTQWENFFALRDHPDAEPHFHDLAYMMKTVMMHSKPEFLDIDQWHLPYITKEERNQYPINDLLAISAARCARISYKPFDGDSSIEKEMERAKSLMKFPVHASPFEHQAQPDPYTKKFADQNRNFHGWTQYRATLTADTQWDRTIQYQ